MEDVIRIPLADGTNIIEVPVDELPDDVSDVLDLLKAEAVDLATYHRFGEAYYRRANYKAFRQLMLQGIAVITDVANKSKYEQDSKSWQDQIKLYVALTDYDLRAAMRMTPQERETVLMQANSYFKASDAINRYEPLMHLHQFLVKARWEMIIYTQGGDVHSRPKGDRANLERAFEVCNNGIAVDANFIPLLLMLGTVYYHLGEPELAIKQFGAALRQNAELGADVRVAIAMCHLHRSPPQLNLAEKAIDRALSLDPNNVQAISAKALFTLRKRDDPAKLAEVEQRVSTSFGAKRARLVQAAKVTFRETADAHVRKLLDRAMSQLVAGAGRGKSCPHALNMIAYVRHYGKWNRMVGGSVSVDVGSMTISTSGDFSKQLKLGQRVRVNDVECSLSASVAPTSTTLTLSAPFVGERSGATSDAAAHRGVAEGALYKQDFEDAFKSAKQASEATASAELKAESLFIMGGALMSLAAGVATAAVQARTQQEVQYINQAITAFDEAIALRPDWAPPKLGSGLCQLTLNEPTRAISYLQQAVASGSLMGTSAQWLGYLYAQEDALRWVGHDPPAHLATTPGLRCEAMKQLESAVESNPRNAMALVEQAQLLQREARMYAPREAQHERRALLMRESASKARSSTTLAHAPGQRAARASLQKYMRALEEMQEARASATWRAADRGEAHLWSNVGALRHSLNQYDGAAAAYCEAFRVLSSGSVHFRLRSADGESWIAAAVDAAAETAAAAVVAEDDGIEAKVAPSAGAGIEYVEGDSFVRMMFEGERGEGTTISYNVALLLEAMGQSTRAEALYTAIIQHQPSYADAYFRLGCIFQDRGDLDSAALRFMEGIGAVEIWEQQYVSSLDAKTTRHRMVGDGLYLLAQLFLVYKGDTDKAEELVVQALKYEDTTTQNALGENVMPFKRDVTFRLLRANVKWAKCNSATSNVLKNLNKAAALYSSVLKKYDKTNVFAANGLGMVLALSGKFDAAYDVFSAVREGDTDVSHVWIHLGHICIARGDLKKATRLYQQASNRFFSGKNAKVLLYLANAWYLVAQSDVTFQRKRGANEEALSTLERALALEPDSVHVKHALARTLETISVEVLGRTPDDAVGEQVAPIRHRTTGEVERAVKFMLRAKELFEEVGKKSEAGSSVRPREMKAGAAAEWCEEQHKHSLVHLEREKELDRYEEQLRLSREENVKRLEGDARAEEQARIDAEEEARVDLKRKAADARSLWEMHAEKMVNERAPDEDGEGKKPRRKKGRKKAGSAPSMSVLDDSSDDEAIAGGGEEDAAAVGNLFDDSDDEDQVPAAGAASASAEGNASPAAAAEEEHDSDADGIEALFGGDDDEDDAVAAATGGGAEGEGAAVAGRKRARAEGEGEGEGGAADAEGAEEAAKRARTAEE